MNTVFRNLLSVLKRFKTATILNILGLSVAFTAFMVIMIQLDYDRNFDRSHPNAGSIFRVEVGRTEGGWQGIINRPLANLFMESSPHILTGTLMNPWSRNIFFSVEKDGVQHYFEEDMNIVYPDFVDMFSLDIVEGSGDALQEPDNVLIPLSMARKLFGDDPATGQLLKGENWQFTVGGVYRDFPRNSVMRNVIYYKMSDNENIQNWGNWNYSFFIRVDDPENAAGLFENFKRTTDLAAHNENLDWEKSGLQLRLTSLPDVHYTTDVAYDATPKASRQTLLVLFAIAIVIVVIAGINFTNFSTALTPMRIKSINTQKVLGEDQGVLRRSLLTEALLTSLLSYAIALVMVALLPLTPMVSMLDADLSFTAHPAILAGTGLIALLTGTLAGLYPAFYMTSFPPALVLKGSFGLSPTGRLLRNMLVGIQFIASFALIIAALFMYLQNHFMQHTPLGYSKDQVVVARLNRNVIKSRDAFTNQLKTFAGVEGVTYAEPLLSSSDQYMGWGRGFKGEDIQYQCLPVDYSFLEVMDVEIAEGRNFRQEDANTRHGAYIFNEKARTLYNMEIGEMIDSAVIVGFMPDVKFASFRTEVAPMAFFLWGTQNWGTQPNYVYVKIKAGSDMRAGIEHVRSTLQSFDSEYTFDVFFFDRVFEQLYAKENKLSSQITLFSLIAVFISIVGVFGLVVFDSEYRRKEIGIRKVMGSTTGQILIMFNRAYLITLSVCFIIAAPVAAYAIVEWLKNFAYKTPMHLWVFAVAFILVAIITVCTVTFQNWRAADDNPINSIKTE